MPFSFDAVEYGSANPADVKKMVVTFHGYGRNGWFMDKVARSIETDNPQTKVISLHAPDKLDLPKNLDVSDMNIPEEIQNNDGSLHDDMQRQWFSMHGGRLQLALRMWKLIPQINAYVDTWRDQFGLKDSDLTYLGFSQGGAVALYSGMQRQETLGSIIAHSTVYWGWLPPRSKPPIYFLYGDQDASISSRLYDKTVHKLRKSHPDLRIEELVDQGHYISSASRNKMVRYLNERHAES